MLSQHRDEWGLGMQPRPWEGLGHAEDQPGAEPPATFSWEDKNLLRCFLKSRYICGSLCSCTERVENSVPGGEQGGQLASARKEPHRRAELGPTATGRAGRRSSRSSERRRGKNGSREATSLPDPAPSHTTPGSPQVAGRTVTEPRPWSSTSVSLCVTSPVYLHKFIPSRGEKKYVCVYIYIILKVIFNGPRYKSIFTLF